MKITRTTQGTLPALPGHYRISAFSNFVPLTAKNLFCDKDKLIRLQKNAIGYNIYVAAHKAQKSCPFHVSKTAG